MTITRQQRLPVFVSAPALELCHGPRLARPGQPCFTFRRFEPFRIRQSLGKTSPQQPGADLPPQTGPKQLTNYVEAGGDYLTLTNGFGYWAGGYARGRVTQAATISGMRKSTVSTNLATPAFTWLLAILTTLILTGTAR